MNEKPHTAILDREGSQEAVRQHLSKQTALLRDIANYGSNLIVRAYDSSPKTMPEIVVCGVFLKQVVGMVDATEILLSAGSGLPALLTARSAFEASTYLEWVLQDDSNRRATRYVVGNYRTERLWVSRVIPGTPENAEFKKNPDTEGIEIYKDRPDVATWAPARLAEINKALSQKELAPVDQEFTKARGTKKHDPEWYELDGLRSIRQVAARLNRTREYDYFYSKGSEIAHAGSYKDHVRFADGKIHFKQIRNLEHANLLLNFLIGLTIGSYKQILIRYRPGELVAFSRKYLDDWRDPYQHAPSIKYNFVQK